MMQGAGAVSQSVPVIVYLKSRTREAVIVELVDELYKKKSGLFGKNLTAEAVAGSVLSRELANSTGIGEGLAFPHARIEGWKEIAMAVGISHEGVDFFTADGHPTKLIFLMISSTEEAYVILQAMSAVLRALKETRYLSRIVREDIQTEDIIKILSRVEINPKEKILVSHIMSPVVRSVMQETSVEDLAHIMHTEHLDVLPVIDGEGKFCGEVSCLDVFRFGMPDFFSQLNTISFVKYIDPFDKLFRLKKGLKAKDLYHPEAKSLNKQNTLMEVIFEMTVKGKSKLFVVDDSGVLIGVIDRFTIIDKILFF